MSSWSDAFEEGSPVQRKSPFHSDLSTDEAAELRRRAVKQYLPWQNLFHHGNGRRTVVSSGGAINPRGVRRNLTTLDSVIDRSELVFS